MQPFDDADVSQSSRATAAEDQRDGLIDFSHIPPVWTAADAKGNAMKCVLTRCLGYYTYGHFPANIAVTGRVYRRSPLRETAGIGAETAISAVRTRYSLLTRPISRQCGLSKNQQTTATTVVKRVWVATGSNDGYPGRPPATDGTSHAESGLANEVRFLLSRAWGRGVQMGVRRSSLHFRAFADRAKALARR